MISKANYRKDVLRKVFNCDYSEWEDMKDLDHNLYSSMRSGIYRKINDLEVELTWFRRGESHLLWIPGSAPFYLNDCEYKEYVKPIFKYRDSEKMRKRLALLNTKDGQ